MEVNRVVLHVHDKYIIKLGVLQPTIPSLYIFLPILVANTMDDIHSFLFYY